MCLLQSRRAAVQKRARARRVRGRVRAGWVHGMLRSLPGTCAALLTSVAVLPGHSAVAAVHARAPLLVLRHSRPQRALPLPLPLPLPSSSLFRSVSLYLACYALSFPPRFDSDQGLVRKEINADVSLSIDGGHVFGALTAKFHQRPLAEVVRYEQGLIAGQG
eukprot:785333-Rhodomonas_salina.2